jgi:hypothetical protein
MIASGAFGLSGRYLVNSFIEAELIGLNCTFVNGIVTTQRNANIEGDFSPSAAWSPTALVRRAQQAASENNGTVGVCSDGVYSKVHYNVTTFCPSEQDVIGNWICTAELSSIITPQNRINDTTVANFASNSTFLYPNNQNIQARVSDDGGYSDLMAWSSNTTLTSLASLSVRLLMAPNLSSTQSANTSNYQCGFKITNPSWSPPNINAAYVLNQWPIQC